MIASAFALVLASAIGPQGEAPPPGDLKPVTIAVVDDATGAPVAAFTYRAWYDAPGREGRPPRDAWTPVEAPSGTVEVKAPASCLLGVSVKAPDFIDDPGLNEFTIRAADDPRRVVVRLRRGITVRGTVREEDTQEPIAGATVTPVVFGLFGGPDYDKNVKTGADGRFEIRGADPRGGVGASHPDYDRVFVRPDGEKSGPNLDIVLKRRPVIVARVVDPDGNPLEGATVDGQGKDAPASGKDGRLTLRDVWGMTVRKDGFIPRTIAIEEPRGEPAKLGEFVVTLEPVIPLIGRVLAPDGRPVAAFTVAAGPGPLPAGRDSVRADVRDPEGRFRLGLAAEGPTWVGVAAEGFAAWEGSVEVRRDGKPLEIRLRRGVTVTAKVAVPAALRDRVEASLVPRRDKSTIGGLPADPIAEELPTRKASLAADGTIRFEHVRPDRYRLTVECPGVPRAFRAVDVPDAGIDVGDIRLDVPEATGRIEGRVWRPKDQGGKPWAFASGLVGYFDRDRLDEDGGRMPFRADDEGRFRIDGVPTGLTRVAIPFMVFDVGSEHACSALVVEGRTTTVALLDPAAHRALTLAFAIGDGSPAQVASGTGLAAARKVDNINMRSLLFSDPEERAKPPDAFLQIDLQPTSKEPLSFTPPEVERLDAASKAVLPDVGAGTYRLRVFDWIGERGLRGGPLFEGEIVVPEGRRAEVRIPLGAGCITGKVPAPAENFGRPVVVTAVAKGTSAPSGWSRCDDDGNFCVRYLKPGSYTLSVIHPGSGRTVVDGVEVRGPLDLPPDPKKPASGYARVVGVEVPAGVVDVGELPFREGAAVEADIRFARPSLVPDEVVAIDASGVAVTRRLEVYSSFDHARIAGLWPGRWTLAARSGGEVLASREVAIPEGGTTRVTLIVGGDPHP